MQQAPGSSVHVSEGLEGVVVSDSRICFVDGIEGRLLYQGYDIHDLAQHAAFEEVAYLLWHGDLPTRAQLDQRATHLRRMSETLGRQHGQPRWFEMSREIEQFMLREKHIYANVGFYSASVYYALGIPIEQYADNRLIRPRAEYVGPRKRTFVSLDQRR